MQPDALCISLDSLDSNTLCWQREPSIAIAHADAPQGSEPFLAFALIMKQRTAKAKPPGPRQEFRFASIQPIPPGIVSSAIFRVSVGTGERLCLRHAERHHRIPAGADGCRDGR